MKPVNNKFVVKPVKVEAVKQSPILGVDGQNLTDVEDYKTHPYQFEVVFAPDFVIVNGLKLEVEAQPGKKVLVTERTFKEVFDTQIQERLMKWQAEQYHVISQHEIVAVV